MGWKGEAEGRGREVIGLGGGENFERWRGVEKVGGCKGSWGGRARRVEVGGDGRWKGVEEGKAEKGGDEWKEEG